MKAKLSSITLLFLFLSVAGTSCEWSQKPTERDPVERVDATTLKVHAEALENLKFAKAELTEFPEQLLLMGKISITEDRTTVVPARVAGRIETISFASGEFVTAGQQLATLFSADFVSAKEEYLQSLKQSKVTGGKGDSSDFANLTQMSRKKLLTMGLSKNDVDQLAETGANDDSGKGSFLLIRAPRSGVIIAKTAVLGNLVNVGETLFTIGDLSKVWFSGDLYPEDLSKVKKGQDVMINVTGSNKALSGKVSFISPIVDPTTRSIKIRALMDNPNGALRGDMYVQGGIILSKNRALLVPTKSIIRTAEGDVIFKRSTAPSIEKKLESVEFKKTAVHVGSEHQGLTAITEGIQNGDEVVSEGGWLLDAAFNSSDKSKEKEK